MRRIVFLCSRYILFKRSTFPPPSLGSEAETMTTSTRDWLPLASKELKGADPSTLNKEMPEGITIKPLYTADDLPADAATALPALPRSPAACAPPCMLASPGRSGSMRASRRRRSPTPSIAATSPPGRRASRSPSISPPIEAMTAITPASSAMSARRAWRSTVSRT